MNCLRLWFLCGLLSGNLFAAAKIDERSAGLLSNLSLRLAGSRTAEVNVRLDVKMTNSPQLSANYSLLVERPNKMAFVLKDGGIGATVISDGTNAYTYLPEQKLYTVGKAPDRIGVSSATAGDLGSMAFIAALFSSDPRAGLLAGVLEAKYVGIEEGVARIDMKQEGLNWSIFVGGELHQEEVRKIVVTIPQLTMSMEFSDWWFNRPIAADRFKFVPPEGAKKVAKLLDEDEKEEGEDSELIGEEIPRLKLKTLDGEDFDTDSLRKQPSILVIWTGEAAHCASALQANAELATARKGVALYGINMDEKPDKARIQDFLGKQKAVMKTTLDPKQEAVEKFELEGVPMTFLIDKKGVIRNAFLGYHADFKKLVGEALDDLIAEK